MEPRLFVQLVYMPTLFGTAGSNWLPLSARFTWNSIELFINKPCGTPTGARIGQVSTILSNTGKSAFLLILMAVAVVISTGAVVDQLGVLHPLGFVAGVKSL